MTADNDRHPAVRDLDDEPPAVARTAAWLRDLLADGPVGATDARAAAVEAGHARWTVGRAKRALGVESVRDGERWWWRLPILTVPVGPLAALLGRELQAAVDACPADPRAPATLAHARAVVAARHGTDEATLSALIEDGVRDRVRRITAAVLDLTDAGRAWGQMLADQPGRFRCLPPPDGTEWALVVHAPPGDRHGDDAVAQLHVDGLDLAAETARARIMVDGAWRDVELRLVPADELAPRGAGGDL